MYRLLDNSAIDHHLDQITKFVSAIEPSRGWPQRPWDHAMFQSDTGHTARVAVDLTGSPILDAEGKAVMSGPGFRHGAVRACWSDAAKSLSIDLDGLAFEGADCLEASALVAGDHGHCWVGTEHLMIALLQKRPDLGKRFGEVLRVHTVEAAVARFYEGPDWEARLARVEARRRGELARPVLTMDDCNWALGQVVDRAQAVARHSGVKAGAVHLFLTELLNPQCFSLRRLASEGVDTSSIISSARTMRDWLPLIEAVEESGG